MDAHIAKLRKKLKTKLSASRYEHSLSVSFTCVCLAMRYEYPLDKAELAGLMHDCAKCVPNREKLKLCKKHKIHVSLSEERNPFLLHAKLGAYFAKKRYGVKDKEVLHAIQVHTTGEPEMNLLDKILYIADYIEPNRDKAPDLAEVRRLAFEDLDKAMMKILSDTLDYLNERGGELDPMTMKTYKYFKRL